MKRMKSETEQRYLIKPEALEGLKAKAISQSRIIQAYLPRLPQIENRVSLEADSATLSINEHLPDGSERQHLAVTLPKDEGEFLQTSGWLDRIRLRYEYFPFDRTQPHIAARTPKAYLTIKGDKEGATAPEYEYELTDKAGALHLMTQFCRDKLIAKTRATIGEFELDSFDREDIPPIAEREVRQGMQLLSELPEWASEDITESKRYGNYAMADQDTKAQAFLQRIHAALTQPQGRSLD